MRQYSILHGLFLSFGSRRFFQDVAANWRGASFVLLLLIALLIALRLALFINNGLSEFDRAHGPGYIRQLPTITVENGRASTPEAIPYMITEPASGRPVAIIDTTREKVDFNNTRAFVYVSQTQVAYRKDANETRIYEIDQFEDMVITRESAHKLVDFLADWLGWILAPFVFAGVYVFKLIIALLYGLVGLLIGNIMKIQLPYDALVSLAIVTAVPVTVVEFLAGLLASGFSIPWVLALLINLALLGFAIYANKPVTGDADSADSGNL